MRRLDAALELWGRGASLVEAAVALSLKTPLIQHIADVVPHQPMRVQRFGSVTRVEYARQRVRRVHIHANSEGLLFNEPTRQQAKQVRGDTGAAPLPDYIDPLQLAVAPLAPGKVSGHKRNYGTLPHGNITPSRRQRALRIVFAIQISGYAVRPELDASGFAGPD